MNDDDKKAMPSTKVHHSFTRAVMIATYEEIVAVLGEPNLPPSEPITMEWSFWCYGRGRPGELTSGIWTTDEDPKKTTMWRVGGAITPFLALFPGMAGDWV